MHIFIVTPAGRKSRSGNRNTAVRWAALLRDSGHSVTVDTVWDELAADLMIALHARRSHDSIARYRCLHPHAPLVLALTGTDLYRDIAFDADAQASMRMADRMIVLQEMGPCELSPELRAKTRVIYQSAEPLARARPLSRCFEVGVIGHLRAEKDPFRSALAAFHLPMDSHIRIVHLGAALSAEFEQEARRLMAEQPRYHWLGERPHWQVRRILARLRALIISSRMEGGANVASEALAAGVPVIGSNIPGNIGMLGQEYEGYYPLEDEHALAELLSRFEADSRFRHRIEAQCAARKVLVSVERERAALAALVAELA
jgi:putative glycosyltransferase (TIGR04348 family)